MGSKNSNANPLSGMNNITKELDASILAGMGMLKRNYQRAKKKPELQDKKQRRSHHKSYWKMRKVGHMWE